MTDYVADEERDEVLKKLLQLPENKVSITIATPNIYLELFRLWKQKS